MCRDEIFGCVSGCSTRFKAISSYSCFVYPTALVYKSDFVLILSDFQGFGAGVEAVTKLPPDVLAEMVRTLHVYSFHKFALVNR